FPYFYFIFVYSIFRRVEVILGRLLSFLSLFPCYRLEEGHQLCVFGFAFLSSHLPDLFPTVLSVCFSCLCFFISCIIIACLLVGLLIFLFILPLNISFLYFRASF